MITEEEMDRLKDIYRTLSSMDEVALDSDEAEKLRDEADIIWYRMTPEELRELQDFMERAE